MGTSGWPVKLAAVGADGSHAIAMGARLWRLNGQLMVTVVAKATFSFASPELVMVESAAVHAEDQHRGGHPMRSLTSASDVAPQLHRAEVLLVGAARPAAPVSKHSVRLAVANGSGAVLDKTLVVLGDRQGKAEPAPFTEMPLEWERCFGGIGFADNPIGMGHGDEGGSAPNILPVDGKFVAVGFAPIPSSFPCRRRFVPPEGRRQLAQPIADVPTDFDWRYFQAAPVDQQLASLVGNEWVALDGFSASQPQQRFRLPGGVVVTRVYGFERAGVPNQIPLMLDTLSIDTEHSRLSLVWRGSFPVMQDAAVNEITVAATYLRVPTAFEWPAESDLTLLSHKPVIGGVPEAREPMDLEGTTTIEADEIGKQQVQTLPFAGAKHDLPRAVRSSDLTGPALSGTVTLDDGEPVAKPQDSLHSTVAIEPSSPPGRALPFEGEPAKAASAGAGIAIPGAPWSSQSAPDTVPPASSAASKLQASVEAMALRAEQKVTKRSTRDESAEILEADKRAAEEAEARAAEAAQKRAAEEAQKRAAEEAREREAKAREAEEAEARRREEAEKFRREQEQASREQEQRAREEAEKKAEAAKKLRASMYGGFKRKS